MQLVVSGAGVKAAVSKVVNASWRRRRVHFVGNALAREGQKRKARRAGLHRHRIRSRHGAEAAKTQWREAAGQLRPTLPKLAGRSAVYHFEAKTGASARRIFFLNRQVPDKTYPGRLMVKAAKIIPAMISTK